jgi:hypothetical protein
MYTPPQLYAPQEILTRRSARGRLSLHPQCLSLRRRRLPPSTPLPATLRAAAESRAPTPRYQLAVHTGGSAECSCHCTNCGERAECRDAAVYVVAEGLKVDQPGCCCRVRITTPACRQRTDAKQLPLQSLHSRHVHSSLDLGLHQPLHLDCHRQSLPWSQHHLHTGPRLCRLYFNAPDTPLSPSSHPPV